MPKDLPCAVCGHPMWRGTKSLPEGQAICHPCRRVLNPMGRRSPCVACSTPSLGVRCRACDFDIRRIRSEGDPHIQRTRREQAAPGLTATQRSKLLQKWKRQSKRCTYCPRPADTVDHVLPLVRGGTNHEGNLTPCCRPCNSSKSGYMLAEWRHSKRLPPRTEPLPWRHNKRKAKPKQWVDVPMFNACECGDLLTGRAARCPTCTIVANRIRARNRYRESVGIPPSFEPRIAA